MKALSPYVFIVCISLIYALTHCALQLHKNELFVYNSQVVKLFPSSLNATSIYWQPSSDPDVPSEFKHKNPETIHYTVSQVLNGYFKRTGSNSPITTFTQAAVNLGSVQFKHDGSLQAPAYMVSVTDGQETISERADVVLLKYQEDPAFQIYACKVPELLLLNNGSYLGMFICASGLHVSFWNSAAGMQQLGQKIQITTISTVSNVKAIQLANQNIIVAYVQGTLAKAHMLSADGRLLSSLTLTDNIQQKFKLAAFQNGNFLLVHAYIRNDGTIFYDRYTTTSYRYIIEGILFEADGTRLAKNNIINKQGTGYTPHHYDLQIASLINDNFIVMCSYDTFDVIRLNNWELNRQATIYNQDFQSQVIVMRDTNINVNFDLLVFPGKEKFIIVEDLSSVITFKGYSNGSRIINQGTISEHNTYPHSNPKAVLLANGNVLFTWGMNAQNFGENRRVATIRDLSSSQMVISEYLLSNTLTSGIVFSANNGGDFMFWNQRYANSTIQYVTRYIDDRIGVQVHNFVINSYRTVITEEHIVISSTNVDVQLTITKMVHCHFELNDVIVSTFNKSDITARRLVFIYDHSTMTQTPSFSISATNGVIRTGVIPIQIEVNIVQEASPVPVLSSSKASPVPVLSSSEASPVPVVSSSSVAVPSIIGTSHVSVSPPKESTRDASLSHHSSMPDEQVNNLGTNNNLLLYAMMYVGGALTVLSLVVIILILVLVLKRNKDRGAEQFQRLEMQDTPSTN